MNDCPTTTNDYFVGGTKLTDPNCLALSKLRSVPFGAEQKRKQATERKEELAINSSFSHLFV